MDRTRKVKRMKEYPILPLEVVQSKERLITPSGLGLVGALLKKTQFAKRLNRLGKPKELKHQNGNCVIGYLGLLCQGKTDYEDMREMLEDPGYYSTALKINTIPSAETVRQRLDYLGLDLAATGLVMGESARLLKSVGIEPTPVFTGHVPLDLDVSPHDNSNTKKEGVARTYKGVDGYAPMYAYLGEEGYACNVELREGDCHSQCEGTVEFLEDTLRFAREITPGKLLARMDSGNDSLDNIKLFVKEGVDFIIKRNLRRETAEEWLETAMKHGSHTSPRDGKVVYTGDILRDRSGLKKPVRIVFKVTVRTMRPNGQLLITPDIDVQTWWTSLENSPEDIVRLYREHATCEQFHSEIKSDIGLERFPSGKFDTNAAILKLAALAYNILRIIGQTSLSGNEKLTRHDVFRLRAKTVINRFMFIAGHIKTHARRMILDLGRSNIWRNAFMRLYTAFA